ARVRERLRATSFQKAIIYPASGGAPQVGIFVDGTRIDRPEQPTTGDVIGVASGTPGMHISLEDFHKDWISDLSLYFDKNNQELYSQINDVALNYIADRATFINGVAAADYQAAFELLERSIIGAMKALDDFGAASARLKNDLDNVEWSGRDIEEIYPSITSLRRRLHLLSMSKKETESNVQSAFRELVNCLADIWIRNGKKPTAPKSNRDGYSPPSDFVRFVKLILNIVPEHLRQHVQSDGALSKAISEALGRRDAKPKNIPE
ncbi:hypothetical protein V5F82_26955, partial [Xanthobacter flavus]